MTLHPGSTIGTYVIGDLLGRGTWGDVYDARHTESDRPVALKVLSPDLAWHREVFTRVQREVRTGAILDHPNIARVFDVGCDRGIPFVASELLRGTSLRARLTRGPLPAPAAAQYAAQIARGLAAAHEAGVTHRDLKPEHIFITDTDAVKILDFGLAKTWFESLELFEADARRSTPLASVVHSLAYLSPEQVWGEEADERSDIFSLGVIVYEMLRGQVPFRRGTPIETLRAIVNDTPAPLAPASDLQADLERIVRRCMAKDRAHRFQSMRDVEFSLEESVGRAGGGPGAAACAAIRTECRPRN
ncbi:MAG TPA: serine/threonine-protein kinase [Vicinamibacterales bacterium]